MGPCERLHRKSPCRLRAAVAAQAAVEEGIVIGGGCTLLRLAQAVDGVKGGLDNDEQKARMRPPVPHADARVCVYLSFSLWCHWFEVA